MMQLTQFILTAVISAKPTAVTGVEGQTVYFRCEYPKRWQSNAKYLCCVDLSDKHLIWTNKHNQWETNGRFSLYDNTTGAFFIIKVTKLVPEDRGTYWCGVDISSLPDHIGVIQLNVSRGTVCHVTAKDHYVNWLHMVLSYAYFFQIHIIKSGLWLVVSSYFMK